MNKIYYKWEKYIFVFNYLNCVEIEIIIIFIMNKHYDEEFSSQGGGDM